jgi:hypothetical protein
MAKASSIGLATSDRRATRGRDRRERLEWKWGTSDGDKETRP